MLRKEDRIRCETRVTKTGAKVVFSIYLCKRCNKEIAKGLSKLKIATGFCKSCYYIEKVEKAKPITNTKECRKCKQKLKLNDFGFTQKGNIHHICKKCKILHKYDIDTSEYNRLKLLQDNKCAICKQEEIECRVNKSDKKDLSVDHDHNTGKIRGLLCTACNKSLGGFKDSIEILEGAIQYLKNQTD